MIVVRYDIADDKLRRHFSKYVEKFGHRLQYSVFQIDNSVHVLDNIMVQIENKFSKRFSQADSIIIFQMSNTCKITKYGYAADDDKDFIVVK